MAERTIIRKTKRMVTSPSVKVLLAGVEVTFRRAYMIVGARTDLVMAAVLDDSNPDHLKAIRQAGLVPKTFRIHSRPPELIYDAPLSKASQPMTESPGRQPESTPTPLDQARSNGWTKKDLIGTGEGGRFDESGGRSPVTGLTASEMALCKPPNRWNRKTQYPWDILDWRGPTSGWKPPLAPSKVKAPEKTVEPKEESVAAPEPEAVDEPETDEAEKPAPSADVIASYSMDKKVIAKAIAVLTSLRDAQGGMDPSPSKARYHLNKNKLPKASKDQLSALLALLS